MAYFTEKFGAYVCDGDTIMCDVDGFTITATLYADDDASPPWERGDGHGPVSDWTSRGKAPGERILNADHGSLRYYDFAEAVKIARRDGWGSTGDEGLTAGAKAERAAKQDYRFLKAWCDDEWHYVGVAVQVSRQGVDLTGEYDNALWGIEGNYPDGDNSYLTEVAEELVDEALTDARAKLAKLTA